MKKILTGICFGISLSLATSALAGVVFTDDFESGLTQWTGTDGGVHNGITVADPAGTADLAMTFTDVNWAGDIFTSTAPFTAGDYWLSFDYFGNTSLFNAPNDNTGGFVGISQGLPGTHIWLWGTSEASDAADVLIDDDTWHSYTFAFTANTDFRLMFEDYIGSGGGAGDAFFDNINLSDSTPVPEPATMLLFGAGLAGLASSRMRKKK